MKYLILLLPFIFLSTPAARRQDPSPKVPAKADIPTVAFCDLLKRPEYYDQKVVRTEAIFRRGGEETAGFYCLSCWDSGEASFDTDEESVDSCTPNNVKKILDGPFDVSAKVTVVGKFINSRGGHMSMYRFQFRMTCMERARVIWKSGSVPEYLPQKVRRKIRC